MATLASGSIVLSSVKDAYNVSLSPNSCVITADYDGSNPKLDTAYTLVSVRQGDIPVEFELEAREFSSPGISCFIDSIGVNKKISITRIPSDIVSGAIEFGVRTSSGFSTSITFQFAVVRAASMLDWVLDWETNKTVIGDTYLITPKIFVGERISSEQSLSSLSGVYIGPDSDNGDGIYGYRAGDEIFHLNEHGGSIGGWNIFSDGIVNGDDTFQILSEGAIQAVGSNGSTIWSITKDGEATFAKGNVQMHADGSASFTGSITANSGRIGGWSITDSVLSSGNLIMDGVNHYIDVYRTARTDMTVPHLSWIKDVGGISIYYGSSSSYGILCHLPKSSSGSERRTFSLGSTNIIAGWSFDYDSIWIGNKINENNRYSTSGITIGTNGLRGISWFIDNNGSASFAGGKVSFTNNRSSISGWELTSESLRSGYLSIISNSTSSGVFASHKDISNVPESLWKSSINSYGGIYISASVAGSELAGYTRNGERAFYLSSSSDSQISSWNFNSQAIYRGTQKNTGFTDNPGDITIGSSGIRGHQWRLESDGSGSLGGGQISWESNGHLIVSNDVIVRQLDTIPQSGGAHVEIEGSEINIFGQTGARNIRFGVDPNGYIVLSYYDNDGTKLYDLGPNGLKTIDVIAEAWVEWDSFVILGAEIDSQEAFYELMRTGSSVINAVKSIEGVDDITVMYGYRARRVDGNVLGNSLITPDSKAKELDGKKFISTNVSNNPNGQLVQGAWRVGNQSNSGGVSVITSLRKVYDDGLTMPADYIEQMEYYMQSQSGKDQSIEIDWTIDTNHPIGEETKQLKYPVYMRPIYIYKDGAVVSEFNFYWQNVQGDK